LPWRSSNDAYHIWLSEVILQQTRVEQGMPYYFRFLKAFPTITALANAPEDEVLNLWQGLGYYSRARNLHNAAKLVSTQYNGKFPKTYVEILALKGVGAYTASAIASIAFGLPHAVVDGNVYRVLSRVFKIDDPIDSTAGKKKFDLLAHELLDPKKPGEHNQALMEIGALICLPANPKCEVCPVAHLCLARADRSYGLYPVKSLKTKVRERKFHYLVVTDGKKTVLKKRAEKDIWFGLYDFPLLEPDEAENKILEEIQQLKPVRVEKDGSMKHILSHQKIQATFWLIHVKKIVTNTGEIAVKLDDLDNYPMPQLLIRYLESGRLSGGK